MLLEGLGQAVLRWLRVPPGASIRHANEVGTSSGVDILSNEYIDTIVGITVDDICIGESPLSVNYLNSTPGEVIAKLNEICNECNAVVKDVAWDLCTVGFSVYKTSISDRNKLVLLPYIDAVKFYLTNDRAVVVVDADDNVLEDVLVFLNYNKRSLVPIEKGEDKFNVYSFQISPEPMQLKNVEKPLTSLINAEANMDRFRALMSRPIRVANVDIGMAQGDQQKDVVDTISSAINANSQSLMSITSGEYDDNIPVLPNRNGKGRVEVYENIPNYNLSDLADIDYHRSKLTLVTRFPSSYMDFSTNLSETTASLLRGDIRYYKMCNKVRSKIVDTLNSFVNASDKFKTYEPCFTLTQLPTSEDEDVMTALDSYTDLATKMEDFILGEGDVPKEYMIHRLGLLQDLFASSTTSPTLQKLFDDFRDFINQLEDTSSTGSGSGIDVGGADFEDHDFGGSAVDFEPTGTEEDFSKGESDSGSSAPSNTDFDAETGGAEDVEFIDQQINV